MLKKRNEEEIKAYAQGYNDCFNQFVDCLRNKSKVMAIHEMEAIYLEAVKRCVCQRGARA